MIVKNTMGEFDWPLPLSNNFVLFLIGQNLDTLYRNVKSFTLHFFLQHINSLRQVIYDTIKHTSSKTIKYSTLTDSKVFLFFVLSDFPDIYYIFLAKVKHTCIPA